jgi:hypothetical protein
MSLFRRCTATCVAASLVFSGMAFAAPNATAAPLIGTEQIAGAMAPSDSRNALLAALDRADLAAALKDRGVSVDELRERVASLTDAEAAQLMAQIDQAPAGAGILGVVFTVFVILLITDILGLTKVFPFTRSVR